MSKLNIHDLQEKAPNRTKVELKLSKPNQSHLPYPTL